MLVLFLSCVVSTNLVESLKCSHSLYIENHFNFLDVGKTILTEFVKTPKPFFDGRRINVKDAKEIPCETAKKTCAKYVFDFQEDIECKTGDVCHKIEMNATMHIILDIPCKLPLLFSSSMIQKQNVQNNIKSGLTNWIFRNLQSTWSYVLRCIVFIQVNVSSFFRGDFLVTLSCLKKWNFVSQLWDST